MTQNRPRGPQSPDGENTDDRRRPGPAPEDGADTGHAEGDSDRGDVEDGDGGKAESVTDAGPGKKRLIDYPRRGKGGVRRWIPSWRLVLGTSFGVVTATVGAATVAYALVEVPAPTRAAEAQNNVYYWADGTQMAATGGEINRQVVDIGEIPKAMQDAVISAENKTFRTDSGIDPMGIGRAVANMAKGSETQGGSTITQQYVKNAMLGDQPKSVSRKVKELFVSIKVGADMDKPDIMAGYLNTSYYGRGAYGIQAAARTYYGKDAKDLNPSECAFLASLLKGAVYFDPAGSVDIDPAATPKANLTRVTDRWKWVMDEMVKDKHLTAAERAEYPEFPMPRSVSKGAKLGGQVGYLVELAKANVLKDQALGLSADDLARGGYEIHTTFDKKKVEQLETAVKKVREADIRPDKRPKTDTHVQFGGASVDPRTGAIVAIYGGEDATEDFTNNADATGVPVGSTFKPFVLAAALRDGVRDPQRGATQGSAERTPVDPDTTVYSGQDKLRIKNYDGSVWLTAEGEEWLQTNDGNESYGNVSLREAMVRSANSPYVQLGMDTGIPSVRKAAVDAGLLENSLNTSDVPSFSLGISSPSAIRMAVAYGTFAAGGEQREPYSVTQVKRTGRVIYSHKDEPERAFPAAVAGSVTDVLKDVVANDEGTGRNARLPGREVAGKTGTTDGNKSAWFVGYTPQLSTAIDMYRLDDSEKNQKGRFLEMFGTGGQAKVHGASFPAEIWRTYMTEALKGQKVVRFSAPEQP
ncbi:transglycosylase domain-containing protein [Streptomyces sp. NPDC051098]|uniref:transglycosylase domain-containing protein n=1 Tax=Streptomyces sp. NPDC051098 TaxID=3155411 RepID=UPI00342F1E66